MIELMFAAALSGMRAAETPEQDRPAPISFRLEPNFVARPQEKDWRKWVGSDFSSFEDERDCPIFFQKDVPGFGAMRFSSVCTTGQEDEPWQ